MGLFSGNDNETAQDKGRAAQKFGKLFEKDLEAACNIIRMAGYGLVVKTNPPVVLTRGPEGMAFKGFAGTGGADFMGAVRFGPGNSPVRPVIFDAKTRGDEASFRVLDGRADVRETERRRRQAAFICDAREYTPLAGYLVFLRKRSRAVFINAPADLAALRRGESVELREPRDMADNAIHERFARVPWGDKAPPFYAGARVAPKLPHGFFPLLELLYAALPGPTIE